jgi:hypothetical protein
VPFATAIAVFAASAAMMLVKLSSALTGLTLPRASRMWRIGFYPRTLG